MKATLSDLDLMRLSVLEARKYQSFEVYPNPRVGAALRSVDGKIVSAFHTRAGAPHAEIEVFYKAQQLGIDTKNASLAVTLEPCHHHGKTGPCTEAILKAGVSRVLIGTEDPNPLVSGKGSAFLKQKGVELVENVLAKECFELNKEWLQSHRRRRSFVRLKMATSLDGLWASEKGQSQWITGPAARDKGHELRENSQLLITGSGTVLKDNPHFSARNSDETLRPRQPKVWVLSNKEKTEFSKFNLLQNPNFESVKSGANLKSLLEQAYEAGYFEVLVEAGPRLSSAFLGAALVDELHLFFGARLLGGRGASLEPFLEGLLPGLEFKILKVDLIDSHNFYLVLSPQNLP